MAKPACEFRLPPLHRSRPVQPIARSKRPAADNIVGAKQLAKHLDLTHPRIHQLVVDEHVLEQLPNGKFNLDDSRVRYIRWLRAPERRVVKTKADNDFTRAKAELIRIRIAEKTNTLMPTEIAVERMKLVIFTFINKLTGIAPRLAHAAGHTFGVRREIEAIIHETRKELGALLDKWGKEAGEPDPTTDNTEEKKEAVSFVDSEDAG
jgi:hypothetical protein